MIIYRPHRGGLKESMAEAREFETLEEMGQYIVDHHAQLFSAPPFEISDIVTQDVSVFDPRTGWKDTRCVCVKRFFNEIFTENGRSPQCIGFCATEYNKE